MNKKGVESFPFFLFLTILIAAVILTISFYQLRSFSEFSGKKEMADDYQTLINTMQNLRATTDHGSFTRVQLKIPGNGNITISPINNTIIITVGGEVIANTMDVNITAVTNKYKEVITDELVLEPGNYDIVVYYGETTNQTEPYEIFFV